MSLAAKLAALSTKSVTLEVKEVKLPDNSADVLTLFESNSAARAATANEWTVDVFPNQIPIITYIMHLASSASNAADHKDKSKSSLATFCLYYAAVFQAFFLLNDLHVRPNPSAHASAWSTISWKNDFATWLLNLPVPEPLEILFSQLSATQTEKTKNVFFVPSAAGFSLQHFLGRFVPLQFFAAIHDCICSLPGNSRPIDIWHDLLPRTVLELDENIIPNKTSITVADILGVSIANNIGSYVSSKWFQCFHSIFQPTLFRDFHRRSNLAPLDLTTPSYDDVEDLNAYDILFSSTKGNLRELKTVLQHVSSVLTSTVKCTKTLTQVIAASSGHHILHHAHSTFALPTWIANTDTETEVLQTITRLAATTPTARATGMKFLKAPAATTEYQTVTAATATSTDDTATIDSLTYPWSIVSLTTNTTPSPINSDFVIFDDAVDTYPRCLVLDTISASTLSAHLATLTGKTIETFEIDGTTIPMPNVDRPLALQNCLFADSAIPLRHVLPATEFRLRTTDLPPVKKRHLPRASNSLAASSLLYDRTKVNLPQLPAHTIAGQSQIRDPAAPAGLPGMTTTGFTNWLAYAQSFFGLHTKISAATTDADLVPNTDENRLYVWSPYTYTSFEDANPTNLTPDLSENRTYFLTNLRTVFGTDTNLVETVHPMEAMPI